MGSESKTVSGLEACSEYTIQKLALVGLTVFYPDPGSYEQLVLGILICFGYTSLLVYYRPYLALADNAMALISQAALFVAMLQSLFDRFGVGSGFGDAVQVQLSWIVLQQLLQQICRIRINGARWLGSHLKKYGKILCN